MSQTATNQGPLRDLAARTLAEAARLRVQAVPASTPARVLQDNSLPFDTVYIILDLKDVTSDNFHHVEDYAI